MLGFALLSVALWTYVTQKKRISILLFLMFANKGFWILTDSVIGAKNADLAVVFVLFVCLYTIFFEKDDVKKVEDRWIKKILLLLLAFFFCSVLFSLYHYNFSILQVVQGGRHLLLFPAYFFLKKLKERDIYWVFDKLFVITIIHSVLYIIEVLTGLPVLPYGKAEADPFTGVLRYYNFPAFMSLFIYLLCIFPSVKKGAKKKFFILILFAALFCTQGRTSISITLFTLIVGFLVKGSYGKLVRNMLLVAICVIPFYNILSARFEGNGNEFSAIISGEFVEYARKGWFPQGTMSYRLAWVAERVIYLNNRPISENIFGLGLLSESQDIVWRKYNFKLGLRNPETGGRCQLTTPDISYGNLLTQFGYVGGFIVVLLWGRLLLFFFYNRNKNPLVFCFMLYCGYNFIESFSGTGISNMGNLIAPFLVVSLIYKEEMTQKK